jgi:PhzF family phenazine biosynthesis protein
MGLPILQIDAFTDEPFKGNPAAVCVLDRPLEDDRLLAIAGEMNLSETAFLLKQADGFNLRWFTPTTEVNLCGHATLASAHALWQTGRLKAGEPARFHTRSGILTATQKEDWIELDFPAGQAKPAESPAGLQSALGTAARFCSFDGTDYLVEVESPETVRRLQPDAQMLARIPARGFIVTSQADDPRYDFISRFFAPGVGIPEDPVTGSAHCTLGPYWAERLGKSAFTAYQASARGGVVRLRLAGVRVILAGQAVTVLRGEIL